MVLKLMPKKKIPEKKPEIEYHFVASEEELYGHIRMTQVAIVILARQMGVLDKFKEDILRYNEHIRKNGLVYSEYDSELDDERITRHDLPDLFKGMKDSYEHMADLIESKKDAQDASSDQRS